MFGSITSWVSEKSSQVQQQVQQQVQNVQQQVQNVQHSIPPVGMPDFFGSKNKNGDPAPSTPLTEQSPVDANTVTSTTATSNTNTTSEPLNNVSAESKEQTPTTSTADESQQSGANANEEDPQAANNKKFGGIEVDAQKALGQAKELGSNLGNMLFSFGKNASTNVFAASTNVLAKATQLKEAIKETSLISDFAKENEKFVSEKKAAQRREEAAVPPWVGYNEEEKLKQEILELSTDSRNFVRSPPPGVDFPFDFNAAYPIALATLDEDANLKDMRFKLVPGKINEENFWRNYFYRVTLIRQSNQLNALNNESNQIYDKNDGVESPNGSKQSISTSSNHELPIAGNSEFVSDSYDHENINVDEINMDLKQLNLNNAKKEKDLEDADWDKELPEDLDNISAEELEKEINQMIGRN